MRLERSGWPSRHLAGRPRNRLLAGTLSGLLMAAAVAAAHQEATFPSGAQPPLAKRAFLPIIKLAPDFALTSHTGHPVSLADLRGKVVMLDFFYASCPDVCLLVSAKLAVLQRRLKNLGVLGKEVVLLSASFDSLRDTPEVLREYARGMRALPGGWFFLRGDSAAVSRLLQQYDVWIKPYPDGSFDHSMRIYLIDRQGRIREIYNYNFFTVEQVLLDIQSLR